MAKLTGAVINVYSEGALSIEAGARGVAAIAMELDWYDDGVMCVYNADNSANDVFAHELNDMIYLREMMKRAVKALVWPLYSGGKKASAKAVENLDIIAEKCGERGNALSVVCEAYGKLWKITTFLDGSEVDSQVVASAADFEANSFVEISGEAELGAFTANLSEGENGAIAENAYSKFLEALEGCDYNVIAYVGDDSAVKSEIETFVKQQRKNGKFIQACMGNYTADCEGVISFINGVVLADGTKLDCNEVSAWLAGATAAADVNESLTYDSYDGAVAVNGELKASGQLEAKNNGLGCFIMNNGLVKIESDINTLVTYTAKKKKDFCKNRVLRVVDGICTDIKRVFDSSFAGYENNNTDGRNRFKASICDYMTAMMEKNAIENFVSDDVEVNMGSDKDQVVVSLRVQPVDSMEKADITVKVR